VVAPLPLSAQSSSRVWRIGVLETTPMDLNAPNFNAFHQSLQDLGYVEGQNLIIVYRSAEGRGERFTELTAELLRLNVDVIVTRGTPAVFAAKTATTTTPIVMAAVGEPLMVVASLAHPGGNITGLSGYSTDLEAKRAQLIKELVPDAVRVAGLTTWATLSFHHSGISCNWRPKNWESSRSCWTYESLKTLSLHSMPQVGNMPVPLWLASTL
jgi:putative ABC transport system substrate-binding protein